MDTSDSKPSMAEVTAMCFEVILTKNGSINKVNHDLKTMRKKGQPHSARINYVERLMTLHKLFPDVTKMEQEKCDTKSVEFRNLGNTHFISKPPQFMHALSMYNKSICYAVSPENISTAIANRSAVFFNLQMYPECLESIRLAREIGVPERIGEKLAQREAMCHGKMENIPPKEIFVAEIGMPANEKIPFLAKCLKLRENKKFGKYVITEEDIPAGTFIAVEESYCKTVANSDIYLRCATCLLELSHLLFPCDNCTQTMFCSNKCKDKGLKDFHSIECPMNGALHKIFDMGNRFTFRLCLQGLLAFPDTETMALALRKMVKEKKTIFSFNWNEELTPEELFTPIYTLPTAEDRANSQILQEISLHLHVITCVIFKMLKSSPILCQRYMTTTAAENIVKDFIYRNLLNTLNNTNSSAHIFEFETSDVPREYGSAIISFDKLISHSCSPNICLINIGSAIGVFAIKKIAAGKKLEYLSASKGGDGHFMIKGKSDRQKDILFNAGFLCECSACIGNYPTLYELPIPKDVPEFRALHRNQERKCFCYLLVATNKKNAEMACAYIRKYGHLYPNSYLCQAEDQFFLSNAFLYGGISLRLRHDFPIRCPNCNDRQ